MNKYQEALETLCNMLKEGELIFSQVVEREEAIERLQELVEKATPMKVEVIDLDFGYFDCPKCGDTFCFNGEGFECNYCPDCGQALDWEIEVQEDE